MSDAPLVSVVTPVFNGGDWLEACIESVRAQTHGRLEHVILDNASTDATRRIAERFAALDDRIRVHVNASTVPLVDNWNRAPERMSSQAAYCWLLPADDMMYPPAIERMLAVALRHPSVGIVGSLRRRGEAIECGGLPADRELFPGRDIGRLFLAQRVFAIAPTTNLVRSDLVRARTPFFPRRYFHEDTAAFLDVLRHTDFGFVHEVLAYSRTHGGSVTETIAKPQQTALRDVLRMLVEYGPDYFDARELRRIERRHLRRYYRRLLRSYFAGGGGAFRRNHLAVLRELGRAPGPVALGVALAEEFAAAIARPRKLLRHLRAAALDR
jgi:glycosyltransferase involved in cell wall biosynthesis